MHRKLGHISGSSHRQIDQVMTGLKGAVGLPSNFSVCTMAKMTRKTNRVTPAKVTDPLESIYSDYCGRFQSRDWMGAATLTFTCEATRKCWIHTVKDRSRLIDHFKGFKTAVKLQSGHKIKYLRRDNVREYVALKNTVLREYGITLELTTPYTPEQNGVAERLNYTITNLVREILIDSIAVEILGRCCKEYCISSKPSFWAIALDSRSHSLERTPEWIAYILSGALRTRIRRHLETSSRREQGNVPSSDMKKHRAFRLYGPVKN